MQFTKAIFGNVFSLMACSAVWCTIKLKKKNYFDSKAILISSWSYSNRKRKLQAGLLEPAAQFPLWRPERDGVERRAELLQAQVSRAHGQIKWWTGRRSKGEKERGLANVIIWKEEEGNTLFSPYSQQQSDGLEKKMKGKTYQKEWYTAPQPGPTRSINLHHSSALLEINSLHWFVALFMGHH